MAPEERGDGTSTGADAVLDAAFAEVLAAERAAEESVAACRAEAERRLAEVEMVVQGLAARAATRRRLWRERHAAAVARKITEVQGQAAEAAEPIAFDLHARARLASAVERLADELCGADGKVR